MSQALHVLVVDDELDYAESVAALLRIHGHVPQIATDGHAALEAVETHRPEVVLLDIRMPGMNGWELARRIKAQAATKPLLIAVTGVSGDEAQELSSACGIDWHLVKPVDPEQLQSLLKSVQARQRGHD